MKTRHWILFVLSTGLAGACASGPEATWDAAQQARREHDLAAWLGCFTARTRRVLENLEAFQAETRKDFSWLKDPFTLLPEASPSAPAQVEGNVARLRVGEGKHELEVVLLREQGAWRIEALELPTFWQPLTDAREAP